MAPVWGTIGTFDTTVDDGVAETMTDYLTTVGTPTPTITVSSTGANTPAGSAYMDGNDFYFEPDAADAGKQFVFTFTASNASGTRTQTMTVNVAAAVVDYSTATWLGNSYIVFNGTWYNGSNGDAGKSAFNGHDFGAQTAITLGGQAQTYGDNSASGHIVEMQYSVYPSTGSASTWNKADMVWFDYANNNNWFRTGTAYNEATVDIANLAAGSYKLNVYFQQQTGASSWIYDSNSGNNFIADFSIAATLSRTPTSLSGFSTVSGTASEAKSFSVTATHLNGNLTVTAPTGYEVSTTSGSGYAGSVTLSRDANNKVTGQTVYVRLKSSASAGTYNGNVTVSGGGTTQVTVALTGSVATPVPEIDVESTHSFGTMTTGQSKTETVTVNNTGTGPLSISGVTFSGTGNGQFSCSPTTATVAAGGSQNLSVTFAPTAAGSYSVTMNIANNDSDENPKGVTLTATVKPATLTLTAAAGASPGTVTLTVSGAEAGATVNVRRYGTSAAASSDTTGTSGTQVTAANANGTFTDSGLDGCKTYYYKAWQTRNSQTSAATDTKSAKTTLATPDVWSTADDGSITLNWPPVKGAVNYTVEIATDDTFATGGSGGVSEGFDAGSSVPDGWAFSSGSVGGTYTSSGNYGAESPSWQIKANATWTTPTFSGPTEVSFWYKGNGGTTSTLEIQQLVSGSWSSIETVNVPSTGTTYSHSLNAAATQLKFIFTKNAGNLALDDVTVTCSSGGGTMMAGYPATVAQPAAGVTNVTHSLSGLTNEVTYSYRVTANGGESCETTSSIGHEEPTAVTPTLTVGTLSGAMGTTTYGTEGTVRTFTVSGSDLGENGTVTVDPPAGYKVSVDGSTWGGDGEAKTLTANGSGVLASTTVRIRLSGASVGTFNGNVSVTSGTASETVSVSGTVTAVAPTVGNPTYASVTVNSATLGGKVTANGGAALTSGGVRYRVNGSGAAWTTVAAGSTPTLNTAFTVAVTGLQPGKTYEFQAYAGNGTQTGYTASGVTFTTLRPTLTVSPLTVSDMAGVQYQDGTPVNVSVSGANMMGNVTVAVTSGFEVSTDGGSSWGSEKSITVAGETLSATTVKVRIAAGSGTGAVTGTLTVSSSNAADVTVSLSGSVSGATVDTGSWLGNSYLVLNGDWYNGSGSDNPALPATLGYLTTLTLGAQVQTYGQNDGETYPAYMTYSIDSGAETTVALIWFTYNNESHNNYFGMGGEGGQHEQAATTLDLSGLSGGEHTLHVYFSQPTSVGSGTLYDDSSTKVTYNVTFVVPAWNGPNTVYWREEAVNGHFVRQDDDGNHDPWWYQITPTVGFHNPNMTDHGPNDIIFNNNIQLSMTNDAASTVNSITFTSSSSSSRTIRGSQTLTVNSSITNVGGTMNFRVPLAFGGDVTVTNSSSKSIYFYSAVNGNGHTLTKKGAGVLYIANAVTVGGATVAAGRLALNVGGSLSSDVSLTASSAVFSTYPQNAANVVDYAGVISGTGQVLKQGSGTTTLSGNNTYSGKTSVTNGMLIVGHANALGSGKSDVHVGLGTAKLKVGDGVTRVAAKSLNFIAADSELVTGAGKVVAVTNNAAIKKVSFDAGNYSGDDTQWAIVTSASGTITQDGALTVVNPPATGACVLELSADNKTLYVTYHKPPAAPTLTVSTVAGNAGQLSVTATPPAGAGVVVVRNETGTFGSPTGSTLPSVGATDWAGGTVVDVTGGTFTDSGLTGCTTYYYSAWSLKNGLWSTSGGADDARTDTPAVPTGLAEGVVTATNAVLNWTGVSGAGGYLMDIAKGTSFGGGAGTVVASADFSSFPAGGTVDISGSLDSYGMTGWTGYQIFTLSGYARLGTSKTNGFVTTPDIASLPAGTEISFKVKQFNDKGGELNVFVWDAEAWDEDDESYGMWVTVGDSVALSSATDWKTVTVTTTVAYAETPVSFDTDQTLSEMRCYIDDIVVTTPGGAPTYVTADGKTYEKYDVGDVTSYLVEGLEEDTDYVWRLYSYGATTDCASDASSADTFTTPPDASLTGVAISDANGAGGASAVAAGNVAAGQTVLVQGSKLVVAAGSVNPTLTGMTFTTAGTAGTADVDSYRVKVTTSGTWAAGDTGLKGTVSCAGAATSHTVTFDSAQTLTAGQTYYVWIEAVTAPGAAGGSTVGVAALTTDAFTTTGARKSGATTATGLQTIGNLTAFTASTGSAQGGKVALTWAVGASGTMTVRWSTADDIPAPGTAWTNEATGLTGGSHTLTGLTGCQGYYFKAWEVVGGVACGTARTNSASASAPAAPTGLGHGSPTAHEATLSWTAGTGAATHKIDLWHVEGEGAVTGIAGTYTAITSTNDLTEGNYIIVAATSSGLVAMSNTVHSGPYIELADVSNDKTATSLEVTTNDAAIVWKLAWDAGAGKWSMKNEAYNSGAGGYAASSGNNNYATIKGSLDSAGQWTMGVSGGLWVVTNAAQTNRALKYNSGSPRFACYTSGQTSLKLFKQSGGSGTRVDDIIGGVVQEGSTVVATNGATSVGLGRLTDGTTYYWTVQALGEGGCAGGVSGQDSFKTSELLGVPTIVTPLTNGVERISGAVTGTPGATVVLKRFESAELAGTGTAWGLSGTLVSVTEETPGSGVWTFADTGLEGCKTYWYKAWQWQDFGGERATSGASAVVSGKTLLGTPDVTATGAGTQMTLSWPAVPGATSYSVLVSSDDSFDEGSGTGDAVLTDDFGWITVKHDASITNALETRGWKSDFVYAGVWTNNGTAVKCARVGKSGSKGWIITPEIDAMANGGTLTFKLMQYSDDTGTVSVELSTDGSTWQSLGYDAISPTTNWTEYTVALPASKTAGDSFFLSWETSTKRAYLDDITVAPNAGSGGTIVHTATLTSAPWETTAVNLEVGHTYYYRVTATNEGGCAETAQGSAMTEDAPVITVTPTHYNFGTVTKNSGEHTADFVVWNAGNVPLKFNTVTLVQDGDAYSFVSPAASVRTADLPAGQSRTYTVQFNPQNSGTRTATLRFGNDAYNATGVVPVEGSETYANTDIPLTGTCFDPATADPEVLWLSVTDGLGVENTVWDESMAHSATNPVLAVTAYHVNGMAWDVGHPGWANWTLYDAQTNVVLANQAFTNMTSVSYDGRVCARFTAAIPALGAANTYRGKYLVGVTLMDATRKYTNSTMEVVPIEQEWLLDDFMRADAVGSGGGALGNGWTARASSGSTPSSAAIRNASLELYGPGGERSGTAGRVAAGRDMSDERYPKEWKEFTGQGSWGFHFKTGAKTVSWADGSTAGAFVLGATHVAWFTTEESQKGVAVMFTNDCVRLARFEKSLLASGTITDLTTAAYNGTQGKWLAVRVDYLPGRAEVDEEESDDGQHHDAVPAKMRLYVKEVEGPGGNPVEECGEADLVEMAVVGDAVSGNLKFGGAVWNHGTAQLSETTGGTFDDIYVPHMDGQGEPMEFHVIDEDTEGPEFYGFSIRGAIAAPDVASGGLTVTGMVHDASGLSGSVAFTVYNGESELYSGTATPVVVAGSSTEYTVSCVIPSGEISGSIRSADCRFVVTATDGDDDRSEGGTNIDWAEGTGSFPFTFSASTPASPGWATAEIDGAEMVVLRWARAAAGTRYVVVRSDTEIGEQSSPQGRTGEGAMDEGTTVAGWGKVVYNGTGDEHLTGTWTAREFIVAPGSTNYFAVYGMTGDEDTGFYFSAPTKPNAYAWATTNGEGVVTHHTATSGGVPVASAVAEGGWPCTTAPYEPGEGVDSFEYRTSVTGIGDTNAQRLALTFDYEARPQTGSGWGGAWTGAVDRFKIHDENLLSVGTHFPAPAGNKLYWNDGSMDTPAEASLYRPLASTYGSGKFFVAGLINFLNGGDGKYVNIVLVDDAGNDLFSFGKQGGSSGNNAAIYIPSTTFGEEHTLSNTGSNPDYGLTPGHGQDYVVAGEVDWENQMVRMWVFYGGAGSTAEIPQVYDDPHNTITNTVALEAVQASWSWADSAPSWAGKVAGIRLVAGSGESGDLGHVYFDEIRFAGTWEELFLFNAPKVYTYEFDKPKLTEASEVSGIEVGTDKDGHRIWQVSDGALAHGDVGLTAQFGLFHRTGISGASFTIQDENGTNLLKKAAASGTNTTAAATNAAASVKLEGTRNTAYPTWWTTNAAGAKGGAVGVAIPTNWISLESNYVVEVTVRSTGGKEATVTSASETGGAGATDLFFGEYGEGSRWDKYIELYNGTGHEIDLYDYYIFRPANAKEGGNDFSTSYTNLIPHTNAPLARLSNARGTHVLAHKETIVLLNYVNPNQKGSNAVVTTNAVTSVVTTNWVQFTAGSRLAALTNALHSAGANYMVMTNEVLDAGGGVPYLLVAATNFNATTVTDAAKKGKRVTLEWLDACGMASNVFQVVTNRKSERFIMSRKDTAQYLPRSAPLTIDPAEWDFRDWGWPDKNWRFDDFHTDLDDNGNPFEPARPKYTNVVATAGQYDRNIGLGGHMEFMVYDDDEVPPAVGLESGVYVDGARKEPEEGSKVFTQTGWSFTRWVEAKGTNTAAYTEDEWNAILAPSDDSRSTTNAHVTWDPRLGDREMMRPGSGQSGVEFNGQGQVARGELYVKCNRGFDSGDTVWIAFDLDMESMSQRTVAFGYKGTSTGFGEGWVEWSETGLDGSWEHPEKWDNLTLPGNDEYTEWAGDIEAAGIPAAAGHLHFRVCLRGYKQGGGSFYLDNFRVEGAPQEVVVTDAEVSAHLIQFKANVHDESGLEAGKTGAGAAALAAGARLDWGLTNANLHRDVGGLANSTGNAGTNGVANTDRDGKAGRGTNSWITWSAYTNGAIASNGVGKALAQTWYTNSAANLSQLKVTVSDADDDRSRDQAERVADFGMLAVVDDDSEVPMLELTSMKPRKGTSLVRWRTKQAQSTAPTHVADGLTVANLDCQAGIGGNVTTPKTVLYSAAESLYGLQQQGWMYNTKYWRIQLTAADAVTVTNIQFQSKGSSVMAPATFTVSLVENPGAEGEAETAKGPFNIATGGVWSEGEAGTWMTADTGAINLDIPADTPCELRITGTGVTATNFSAMNARWTIFDLQILGGANEDSVDESEAYTYLTDHALATGTNAALQGYLWDPGSGLAWTDGEDRLEVNPRYVMTKGVKAPVSGELAFAGTPAAGGAGRRDGETYSTNNLTNGGATGKTAFKAELPLVFSYTNLSVTNDYGGTIYASDADDDRRDGTNRVDQASIEDEFAFGVVDQDVVGPDAPGDVRVNGEVVPEGGWSRETAPWTTNPEFLVTFTEAVDVAPTVDQLTAGVVIATNNGVVTTNDYPAWRASNNVERVSSRRKAGFQTGVSGIGEYRVALATNEASLSNAPAYSVAATNGAIGNYGFERFADLAPWSCADAPNSAINKQQSGSVYPASEGTNAFFIRDFANYSNALLRQVIAWTNTDASANVELAGSVDVYKNAGGSRVFLVAEASATEDFANPVSSNEVQLTTSTTSTYPQKTWLTRPVDITLADSAGASFLRITLLSEGGQAYLDNVRLSVKKGTVGPSMRYVADTASQGLGTKYLFAADADNDRKGDRRMGKTALFHTAYDVTPPTEVEIDHGEGAITEGLEDPTTQMKLTWDASKVGPDDPYDGHYQDGWTGNDVLSPWETYKVYYTPYDANATTNLNTEAKMTNYVYETFLKPGAAGDSLAPGRYTGWSNAVATKAVADPTAPDNPYAAMSNRATGSVTLYDLENDQDYLFVVVGVDKAGNEGPATTTSWATNNTIKFELKKGWRIAKDDSKVPAEWRSGMTNDDEMASALAWTASGGSYDENMEFSGQVKKEYDLLKWDARSFQERPDNPWERVGHSIMTNWFVDDGGPTNRGSIRFYRASYKDRWQRFRTVDGVLTTNAQTPLVSAEVYAQTAIPLRSASPAVEGDRAGWNFVALHGEPYTNTFFAVFGGTNEFPGGDKAAKATCIDFYEGGSTIATKTYWLSTDGNWYLDNDPRADANTPAPPVTHEFQTDRNFFTRGFSINLPYPIPDEYVAGTNYIRHGSGSSAWSDPVPYMLWNPILRVPTNGFSQEISCPATTNDPPVYNIVALRLPVAAHPSEMNLVQWKAGTTNTVTFGMTPGRPKQPWAADLIYTIDTVTREPERSCYCAIEGTNLVWRFAAGDAPVPAGYFKPNDVLVILSRNPGETATTNGTKWTWTYDPETFYPFPHRNMSPSQASQ